MTATRGVWNRGSRNQAPTIEDVQGLVNRTAVWPSSDLDAFDGFGYPPSSSKAVASEPIKAAAPDASSTFDDVRDPATRRVAARLNALSGASSVEREIRDLRRRVRELEILLTGRSPVRRRRVPFWDEAA